MDIFKFLLILLVSLLFCVVFLGVAEDAVEREMVSGQILERFIGIPAFFVMVVTGLIVPLAGYAFFKPSAILNACPKNCHGHRNSGIYLYTGIGKTVVL